jgi:hypothetical protein
VEIKECTGCRGFCGAEELTLEVEQFNGFLFENVFLMFRSWRCLIRFAIRQHELSSEPRPAVTCDTCGATASQAREGYDCGRTVYRQAIGAVDAEEVRCMGILRRGWNL